MSEYDKLIKETGRAVDKNNLMQIGLVADQMLRLKIAIDSLKSSEINLQKQFLDLMLFACECGNDATTIETDAATFTINEMGGLDVEWKPIQ